MTALDSLIDPGNLDPSDDRIPAQRRADALVDLCRDQLNHGELPTQRTERPHVMVHLSIDALEGRAGRPCELDDAGVITPRAARQLACDAKITRIITTGESQVLDVGRVTRVVSGRYAKSAHRPRRRLRHRRLRSASSVVRRASREALGRWRTHQSRQSRPVVRTPPHSRPRWQGSNPVTGIGHTAA